MTDLTPDDLARLLLPATPALLEGWCGPIVDVIGGHAYPGTWTYHAEAWAEPGNFARACRQHNVLELKALDLARAECADRVARVIADTYRAPGGATSGAGDGVMWENVGPGRWMLRGEGDLVFGPAGGNWGGLTVCSSIAGLDPVTDPRRLPDGSRYVDRLALRLVAEEVLGG